MKYLVKIYWSDEDEAYVAEVPALEGCVSHGDSYEEAAKNIQESVDLWLEVARKYNDPIPEPDLAAEEIRRVATLEDVKAGTHGRDESKHSRKQAAEAYQVYAFRSWPLVGSLGARLIPSPTEKTYNLIVY